ncbi:MAG: hypothetical protein GY772_29730 [bacterium]|nr:hypothetical protein [bacterium]
MGKYGLDYVSRDKVLEKVRKDRKSLNWATRASAYQEAIERINKTDAGTRSELRRSKTELAKTLAKDFLSAIKTSDMLDAFMKAGTRLRKAQELWDKYDKLQEDAKRAREQGQKAMAEELERQADKKVAEFEDLHEPLTFAGRDDQWKMLDALDYDDRVVIPESAAPAKQGSALGMGGGSTDPAKQSDALGGLMQQEEVAVNSFYCCRAKVCDEHCGYYFPSKLWKRTTKDYYCEVVWDELLRTDCPERDRMVAKYGDNVADWPKVGCGARFRPWGRGESQVWELTTRNGSVAWLSSLMPQIISDEVLKVKASWHAAVDTMTPEELYEALPMIFPKCYAQKMPDGFVLPGVSKFPLAEWIAKGSPTMTESAWCEFAMKVASNDMAGLESIFMMAQAEKQRLGR